MTNMGAQQQWIKEVILDPKTGEIGINIDSVRPGKIIKQKEWFALHHKLRRTPDTLANDLLGQNVKVHLRSAKETLTPGSSNQDQMIHELFKTGLVALLYLDPYRVSDNWLKPINQPRYVVANLIDETAGKRIPPFTL